MEGQHAGAKGTIKHIDRTTLFLHSRTHTVNGGIFPVRARSALLAGRMNRGQVSERERARQLCSAIERTDGMRLMLFVCRGLI